MAASRSLWASRAASYLKISAFPRAFSTVLKDLKYAETHEWVKDHLGDVVYVELPEVGASVSQGTNFGAVESVKATSDINSPVSGEVNGDPYEGGWIIKVKVSDAAQKGSKHGINGICLPYKGL
uniref:Lipoyl-binding domain-containing protein n=1 Tax=Aegilops tauschii TaxID=37682 RepID=M8C5W8_AEGTA